MPDVAQPCATCPWLIRNHGIPHPTHWYAAKNLRRLWSGIRRGEGMICHSTDPDATSYGALKNAAEGNERMCIGSLVLVARTFERLNKSSPSQYHDGLGPRMTRRGIARWVERFLFRATPLGHSSRVMPTQYRIPDPVGVPWPDDILNERPCGDEKGRCHQARAVGD
jgi:hypothetical protein